MECIVGHIENNSIVIIIGRAKTKRQCYLCLIPPIKKKREKKERNKQKSNTRFHSVRKEKENKKERERERDRDRDTR